MAGCFGIKNKILLLQTPGQFLCYFRICQIFKWRNSMMEFFRPIKGMSTFLESEMKDWSQFEWAYLDFQEEQYSSSPQL
jgi:hypothetical protein